MFDDKQKYVCKPIGLCVWFEFEMKFEWDFQLDECEDIAGYTSDNLLGQKVMEWWNFSVSNVFNFVG